MHDFEDDYLNEDPEEFDPYLAGDDDKSGDDDKPDEFGGETEEF